MKTFLIPSTTFLFLGIVLTLTSSRLDAEIPTLVQRVTRAINMVTEDGTLLWILVIMFIIPILAIPVGWHSDNGYTRHRTSTQALINRITKNRHYDYEPRKNGDGYASASTILSSGALYIGISILLKYGSERLLNITVRDYLDYTQILILAIGFSVRDIATEALFGLSADSYISEGALCEYCSSYRGEPLNSWKLRQRRSGNTYRPCQFVIIEKNVRHGSVHLSYPRTHIANRGPRPEEAGRRARRRPLRCFHDGTNKIKSLLYTAHVFDIQGNRESVHVH